MGDKRVKVSKLKSALNAITKLYRDSDWTTALIKLTPKSLSHVLSLNIAIFTTQKETT